ncbi:MAG: N-acetyltransferase family protein [Terriglobales bacterium]
MREKESFYYKGSKRLRSNAGEVFKMTSTDLTPVSIETMTDDDWAAVRAIYAEGMATGQATFEQSVPDWDKWNAGHFSFCRLAAKANARLLGLAALSPVSSRQVYAGVAEVSIYVAQEARGRGIGRKLLSGLVQASEGHGIWTLQAGIFPENTASIELHKRCGFRIVGTRERVGRMNGRWRDTVLMERRSSIAGLE